MSDFLKYKDYYATVHFSAEDEVFYGKIEGINDLVSFEGTSVATLKKAFKEAIADYIIACNHLGKEPEKAYKGSFNVRVSSGLHKEAAMLASQKQLSLNELINAALSYAVKHENVVLSK